MPLSFKGYTEIPLGSTTFLEFEKGSETFNILGVLKTGTYKYVGIGNTLYIAPTTVQHVIVFDEYIANKGLEGTLFAGFISVENDIPDLQVITLDNASRATHSDSILTSSVIGYDPEANIDHTLLLKAIKSPELKCFQHSPELGAIPLHAIEG